MQRASITEERGTTLVEVMAAAALLAVGALGILTGIRVAGLTSAQVDRWDEAAAVAQEYVEQNREYTESAPYHEQGPVPGHDGYEMELNITPYGDSGKLVQVSAAVWYRQDPDRRASYTTLVEAEP